MRIVARVEDVGDIKANDFAALVDRRTAHYRDPILLAKALLRHTGRTPLEGGYTGWSFLIRTPETIEDALRLFLAEAIPGARIRKGSRRLEGTALTLNPDLVFGASPTAVGDVKYKLSSGEWNRVDLYQLVAFGTGFRVAHALMTRFREPTIHPCPDLIVGDLQVSERTWPADPLIPAAVAAAQFVDGVRHWINLQPSPDSPAA